MGFIICNNEDEIKSNMSCWGNETLEISAPELAALITGKTLAAMVNDEYGVFIKLGVDTSEVFICCYADGAIECKKYSEAKKNMRKEDEGK